MSAPTQVLCLSKDFKQGFFIERANSSTGATEPATGISDLKLRFSATKGGAAINAAVSKNGTEYGSTPGLYTALFPSTDLLTHLSALSEVWLVLSWDSDTERESLRYRVTPECG